MPEAAVQPRGTVLDGFDEWAAKTPDAVAVVSGTEMLTYGGLDERANQLAWGLRDRGVGAQTVVGICLHRGLDLVVAVLAVVKAGGAFLPLEPDHPDVRLQSALDDANAVLLLAEQPVRERLTSAGSGVPMLGVRQEDLATRPTRRPDGSQGSDDLLYVLFTSGSTGQPKGIAMHQGPQITLLNWSRENYAERPVALQYFPITADVAFLELLSAWWSGGTVVVASEHDRHDIAAVGRLIGEHEITKVLLPVAAMQQLAVHSLAHPDQTATLRELITTGDRLVITPEIRRMCERLPGARFDDHYGSTEVNVVTAPRLTGPPEHWPDNPPLGKPIAEARIYVLDDDLNPAPKNIRGHIYVGGPPPARGYLGRGALTAASFVPDPFSQVPGARMYHTGDLGRWRVGGVLEFLGRADFQIKVRGYRIEPGEVEALLMERDDVHKAVVVATRSTQEGPDATVLAAYVVPTGPPPHVEDLRDHVSARLPAHLVPQAFVVLEQLPLTDTGKIDRAGLPRPQAIEPPFVAPRDDVEAAVAAIWSEALGVEAVGVKHDFFRLGGHSMLVTRVVYQVRETLGVDLPLSSLFRRPTVEAMAAETRGLLTGEV